MKPIRSAPAVALVASLGLLLSGCAGCARMTEWSTGARRVEPRDVGPPGAWAAIIDLRPASEYEAGHVPGAVRLAFEDVNGYLARLHASQSDVPVLIACEDGIEAALAWPAAQMHGFTRAFVLGGGMAAWREQGLPLEKTPNEPRFAREPPQMAMSRFAQVMNVAAGLGLKPTYMLLVLAMVLRLRKVRRPIGVLWHGLLWFFVGEAFCAANLAFHLPGHVYLSDVGHGAGMVAMSALIPWGLYAILDERVLRFSDPSAGCRFQALCGRCWKRDPVRCGLHDLMLLMLPALAIVSLLPLSGPLRPLQVVSDVLGTKTDFGVPVLNLFVELRVYPVLGFLGFLATFAMMVRGGTQALRRATPLFFVSLGLMAYSLLRFLLSEAFREAFHWSNFWEELTEMFMVLAIGAFLYVFRRQLALVPAAPAEAAAPAPAAQAPPAGG
ncbi:MAG TPA: rhodanese-like domain-containing protein [Myxococcales bacterium]|jgi:rhodanese-related sulfurtransferase